METNKESPAEPVDEKVLADRKAAYRQGLLVLAGLAVLTALEFWIATAAGGSTVFLFILALAKAGVIVQYYMHLDRVWSEEEAH
jgi:heme/copper-type cytochrome/quinol oxidase subunit 4